MLFTSPECVSIEENPFENPIEENPTQKVEETPGFDFFGVNWKPKVQLWCSKRTYNLAEHVGTTRERSAGSTFISRRRRAPAPGDQLQIQLQLVSSFNMRLPHVKQTMTRL